MNNKRQIITETKEITYKIDGFTPEKIKKNMDDLISDGFTEPIDVFNYVEYGSPSFEIRAGRKRLETDKEMEQRIKKEYEENKRRDEFELLQFERLRKKFGDN